MNKIEILDFDKMCRLCLESGNDMLPLIHVTGMYLSCTSIEISENDGMPQNVCSHCLERLKVNYKFKLLCVESDTTLKNILNNSVNMFNKTEHISAKQIYYNAFGQTGMDNSITNTELKIENKLNVTKSDYINIVVASDENMKSSDHTFISYAMSDCSTIIRSNIADSKDDSSSVSNQSKLIEDDKVDTEATPLETVIKKRLNRLKTLHNVLNYKTFEVKKQIPKFKCDLCVKEFRKADRLEAHSRVHQGKKPELCKECGRDFTNSRSLRRHMLKHGETKKYHCKVCLKDFTYSTSLAQHLKIHDNNRQFVCDLCGKSFVQSNGLTSHLLTHTTDTPFSCEVCGNCYKSQHSLKAHVMRHDTNKNYICSTCGKSFATTNELNTHMRSHSGEKPYGCEDCDKYFKTRSHLSVHKRSHTGFRPYACDLCTRTFAHAKVLKHHRMTHTGERPHICMVCDKAFTQRGALKTHMKTHKPIELCS